MDDDSEVADTDTGPNANADTNTDVDAKHEQDRFAFPVIGIGASAGGLESLEQLFGSAKIDLPVAFVVVQHLSPDFKSMMDEILRRHTDFTVKRVIGDTEVVANTIYLNSPKTDLIIDGNRLRLVERELRQGVSQPIDRFFKSLAQSRRSSCAAVVLSGSGSDGSRGVREVCEEGGVVLVESPEHAKFDGMPRAAIDAGVVDFTGSADQIAQWITRFVNAYHSANGLGGPSSQPHAEAMAPPVEGMQRVIEILHEQFGIDFAKYKPNMIVRRIGRRLQMMHSRSIEDYIRRLESDPNELDQLYRDLLIGVTRFFRDSDAFQVLSREVVPKLLHDANGKSLRIWTPGCATGEETYSLAITINEIMQREGAMHDVKIFATDAHRHSLKSAAAGIYSSSQLEGVGSDRLANYFQPVGDEYQVRQSIRKKIVFAPQNLLRDASFTNVDLVVCRNTLIYFDADAQQRALGLMHFGLRVGGYLFLGPSETPGRFLPDYETVDRRWRIYKKVSNHKTSVTGLRSPDRDLSSRFESATPQKSSHAVSDRMILAAIEDLAAEHLPPTFITDHEFRLLYSTAGASKYLRRQEGRFGSTLPELLISGLKTNVLVGLQRSARQTKDAAPIVVGQISVPIFDGSSQSGSHSDSTHSEVRAVIRRVSLRSEELSGFSVTIMAEDPREVFMPTDRNLSAGNLSPVDVSAQKTLEEELRYTKENLQATIQELEASNEELQATNEEMVAANEELQSTNEELHSVNEELYTVNAEHQSKIEQLTELTEDMDNLFLSSNIATLFLDDQANIRRITPRAAEIFGLKPEDAGRNLTNFRNPLKEDSLYEWIAAVNDRQENFEQEVQSLVGDRYLLRIHPYQSSEKQNGVVVNLVSLQRLEQARLQLESNEARFRGTFENAAVGIAHVGFDGTWLRVNQRLCDLVGYGRAELLATDFQSITYPDDLDADLELFQQLKAGDIDRYTLRKRYVHKDGGEVPIQLTVSIQQEPGAQSPYCIAIVQDTTELSRHEKQLERAIENRDQFLAVLSHELRNPLGAVANAIQLLDCKSENRPQEETRLLELVNRQTNHMKSLVDDLLDTRRLSNGEINLRLDVQSFTEIIFDSIEALKSTFDAKGQELETDFCESNLPIVGDRTRLLQAAENLLTNASRYTQRGGKIVVKVDAIEGHAVLKVIDNGRGIRADQMDSIFEMFTRGDSNWKTQGGLGVGLALSRMLVEKHGGRLSAQSDGRGRGATFTLSMPLVSDTSAVDRRAAIALRKKKPIEPAATTIVLIEDDDDARMTFSKLLELSGHQVTAASSGAEGIASIRKLKPKFALVDLSMPDMSGLEVIAQLQKEQTDSTTNTKFVAITGHGQPGDLQRTEQAGFAAHFVKPIDIDQLNAFLASQDDES